MANNWNDWNRNDSNRYDRGDDRRMSYGSQDRNRSDESRYGSDRNFDNQSTYRSGEQDRGSDRWWSRDFNDRDTRNHESTQNDGRSRTRDWNQDSNRGWNRGDIGAGSGMETRGYEHRDWNRDGSWQAEQRDTGRDYGSGSNWNSGFGSGNQSTYGSGTGFGMGSYNTNQNQNWGGQGRQNEGTTSSYYSGSNAGWGQNHQNQHSNQGSNAYGMSSGLPGFRSGSDYGSYGRDDRFGSFGHRDDQNRTGMFGGNYNRGTETSRAYTTDMGYGGGFTRDTQVSSQGWGMGNTDMNRSQRGQFTGRGPKGWRRSDERVREDVSETLELHPEIDASEIEVEVKEGLVTLKGSVADRRQKRMAEDIIESCAGVRDIRNELSVNMSFFERAKEALMGETTTEAKTEKTTRSGSKH